MKKVAIYCRVSTADQSCDRQESDLIAYAAKAAWEVTGIWKETGSGKRLDRQERKKVMALAQRRDIDAILVTELTRWGRSTLDLIQTLNDLHSWGVSVVAQTGLQVDLTTAQGRLIASIMAALAEFESDLIRERVKSGMAAAKLKGKHLGRLKGCRPKADKYTSKVLELRSQGQSFRAIAKQCKLSLNTVVDIVERNKGKLKLLST